MENNTSQLRPFEYDPAYPFLFCTLCRYAVLVPSTFDHLKDVHDGEVPKDQRMVAREAARQLRGMYQTKEDMKTYRFPDPGDSPIAHLREPISDGLQCNECGWITKSVTRMRRHCCQTRRSSSSISWRWRTNVRCQQLFAKGPNCIWFEVGRGEDIFSSELTAWLHGSDELSGSGNGGATSDTDTDTVPGLRTIETGGFEMPMQMRDGNSELEPIQASVSSSEAGAGDECATRFDPSWLAVAKSGVACVLCTVCEFHVRCTLGTRASMTGGVRADHTTDEVQCVGKTTECRQCGLPFNWHELNSLVPGGAVDRLQDGELVHVARMVALWHEMSSVGTKVIGLDPRRMVGACAWLGTGEKGLDDVTRAPEQSKLETPRSKTVITRHGQITPADEWAGGYDALLDGEIGVNKMDTIAGFTSATEGRVCKREASDQIASTPAKVRRVGLGLEVGEGRALSLFNESLVAHVHRTNTGMRHEAMRQHESDAYRRWVSRYRVLDDRGEARELRELHKRWRQRCGVCWFGRGDEARAGMACIHAVDKCPQRGSAIWESATRQADVIQGKVLRKRTVRGEVMDWPVSSGCWRCGLPAWRCDSFEHIPGRFFHPRSPEAPCQDEDLLRNIAGSVLAHFEAGAACVVAQVKESWGQEKTALDSKDGIEWLQDYVVGQNRSAASSHCWRLNWRSSGQ